EHGTVGAGNPGNPGFANDILGQTQGLTGGAGSVTGGNDNIRVLALVPAIAAADIEGSLSKFDARWVTALARTTTGRPVGTVPDTFQAAARQATAINTTDANFTSSLTKPLPTGGVAGITFRTDYELSNLNPRINPSYRPALQFAFDQPLLQG